LKAKTGASNNTSIAIAASDLASTGPTDVRIYGLTIDANAAGQTGTKQTIPLWIIAAQRVTLHDVILENAYQTGDCLYIGGNSSTSRLSTDITVTGFLINNCGRNGVALVGASRVHIAHGRITGAIAAPGNAIDAEPDDANSLDSDIVIEDLFCNGNGTACIAVDPSTVAGGVSASMAMNIIAVGNCVNGGTCQDFMQYIAPATKAGFRFINANGTFGGSVPAVDALP
jgi:hypothetical protein